MKESVYNLKIKMNEGKMLMYNSLSRSLSLLDPEDVTELNNVHSTENVSFGDDITNATPTMHQMMAQGFLIPDSVDELNVVKVMYEEARFKSNTVNFIVCSTLACNFGCDYCFQGLDKPMETMKQEVQDGIVDMFEKLLNDRPDLTNVQFVWYGGEPLVKKKIIMDLADRMIPIAKAKNVTYSAMMVSNGYLMDKKTAKALYERGLHTVQITLDGSKEFHDARRHLLSKKGTYDRILSHLKDWIDEVPIMVNIRVNIDERNKDAICELIDDLEVRGLSHKRNFKMYFSPVESITEGCKDVADKMMQKVDYGQLEIKLYRYAFEHGLADLPYPPRFLGICSALRPNDFILVPNGDIHKCWDTVTFPEKRVGNVFDDTSILVSTNSNKKLWDSFNPFDNEICVSCKILPNCSGYCAHKFVYSEDTSGESILPCPSIKYSINERLVLRAEKSGIISKEDYDPSIIRTDPYELTPKMHTVESMRSNTELEKYKQSAKALANDKFIPLNVVNAASASS
ncbi:MAG: TIGR04463 family radical SAM/SPASM RiPP maturase [Saprospiraceae bacterium]|nr:TIGR04463 family radical SAM/SPASM RiPP maturase [Saprospiraceae bacterium]